MQALMTIVAGIEVAAEHADVVRADQLFDHFPFSRMMVLKIADVGRGDTPDVAIRAVFSPPRLIGLHRWTSADLHFERSQLGLHLGFEPMQQLHNLSTADRDPVQREQVDLDLSNGQSHHRAQCGDQTGQSHSQASLTDHLLLHVQRRFIPVVALCTPPLVDPMLRHLDGWRWGHINDLS